MPADFSHLIVNADDFGITKGASEAIVECHRVGSVTSTTFMANMDAAEYAADLARTHSSLGVGLHFNLTLGPPVSRGVDVSSLTGGGDEFRTRAEFVRACLFGSVRSKHIRAELEAQYSRMRVLGITPTHIDSHQHIHVVPQVFAVIREFANDAGLPVRAPMRWTGRQNRKEFRRKLKESILEKTLILNRRLFPLAVATNTGFCSVFDLGYSADTIGLDAYKQLLSPYRSNGHSRCVELMVHPAVVDRELMVRTGITSVSQVEFKILKNKSFVDMVQKLGFHLCTYEDVGRALSSHDGEA